MKLTTIRLGLLIVVGHAIVPGARVAAQDDVPASHVHIRHASESWDDTPSRYGLLIVARMEAEVAATHAELAALNSDLETIQVHVGHAMHAIDPTAQERGPGQGYGLIQASSGGAIHIGFASDSEGASENVKLHATHISISLENTLGRAREVISLGYQVLAATDPGAASELAQRISLLTKSLISGNDADGDGRVGWGTGEGGLEQAAYHLNLMKGGEGII